MQCNADTVKLIISTYKNTCVSTNKQLYRRVYQYTDDCPCISLSIKLLQLKVRFAKSGVFSMTMFEFSKYFPFACESVTRMRKTMSSADITYNQTLL